MSRRTDTGGRLPAVVLVAAVMLSACGSLPENTGSAFPGGIAGSSVSPSPHGNPDATPTPTAWPVPDEADMAEALPGLTPDCRDLETERSDPWPDLPGSPSPDVTEEARLQAEARERAAPPLAEIEAYARSEAAEEYAGVRIDRDTWEGQPLFTVAFTGDPAVHEPALRERLGPDVRLAVVQVEHSIGRLQAVQETIDYAEPAADSIVVGSGVNRALNRLSLSVVAVDDEARRVLGDRYGADLVCIEPVEGPPLGTEPGGGAPGVVPLPTSDVANMHDALMDGVVLAGDEDLDGGCLWVEAPDGTPRTVVWPPGYGARFTPEGAELVDETGTIVAREGDQLSMGGSGAPDRPLDRCMVGELVWVAGNVSTD